MTRSLSAVVLVLACGGLAAGQADDVTALADKFRTERAESLKLGEPADRLAVADQLVAKAEAAQKAGNAAAAARLFRDARWALPARPLGLPDHVERVIGYVRLRHADRVNAVAYTPDGTRLVSTSRDGTARVWDLGNGREVLAYRGHPAPDAKEADDKAVFRVPAVAVSPDGQWAASAGSGEVHVWSLTDGKLKKKLTAPNKLIIHGVAFLPDGRSVVTAGDDKFVRIYSVETGKETTTFAQQASRIEAMALSPNGGLIATVDANGILAVYKADGSDKKPVMSVQASDLNSGLLGVVFSADGSKLFTGGAGGSAPTPRLTTGPGPKGESVTGMSSTVLRFPGHTDRVLAVAGTRDGKLFASTGDDRSVRVWDAANGKPVRHFQGLLAVGTALAVRPDGKQLAVGTDDGTIRLWDLSSTDENRPAADATDSLWAAAFSPDGAKFATAGADRTVRVYDTATGKLEHKLTGHTAAVTAVAFLPGDRLASAAGDKLIKLWDAKAGTLLRDLAGHGSAVLTLAADGGTLVSGGIDKTVKGWNLDAGKPTWSWTGRSAVAAVAVRKGGRQVAVGTADGWLTVLDLAAGEPKPVGSGQQAHVAGVAAAAFSGDGAKLATVGGDGKLTVWAVADDGGLTGVTKDEPKRSSAAGPPTLPALSAVAFGADGKLVASAGADMAVHVWDTATGGEVRTLRGPTDWVTAVAFAPTGEHLLAAGVDRVARLFELSKAEAAARVGHAMAARAVAVRKDGRLIASGSDDKTVKLWELATGKEVITLTGAADWVYTVCFAGDSVAAGGQDSRLRVWAAATGKIEKNAAMGKVYVLQPSVDGKKLGVWARTAGAMVDKDTYEVVPLDAAQPRPAVTETGRPSTCATFAADLSWVASGDDQGHVRIWDTATRKQVDADWPIHSKKVIDLTFTADKKTLLAVDETGLVKIADVAKREVRHTAKTGIAGVAGLMMAPTGQAFAVIGGEGEVKAFDLTGKELRAWAMPSGVNGVAFTPDGKKLIAANADGTLAVLVMP